jgi:hypothetical protein
MDTGEGVAGTPVSRKSDIAVKCVSGSVASKKRKDVCEQNEERTEHDHNGRRAQARRADQKMPKPADEAAGREFTRAEKQECRSYAEYSQQRENEADEARDSSHVFSPKRNVGCNRLRFQPPADPPWPSRQVKSADEFCHALTMRRRLAVSLRGMVRICAFSCRSRADEGSPGCLELDAV